MEKYEVTTKTRGVGKLAAFAATGLGKVVIGIGSILIVGVAVGAVATVVKSGDDDAEIGPLITEGGDGDAIMGNDPITEENGGGDAVPLEDEDNMVVLSDLNLREDPIADEFFEAYNKFRTDPTYYKSIIQEQIEWFKDEPYETTIEYPNEEVA